MSKMDTIISPLVLFPASISTKSISPSFGLGYTIKLTSLSEKLSIPPVDVDVDDIDTETEKSEDKPMADEDFLSELKGM